MEKMRRTQIYGMNIVIPFVNVAKIPRKHVFQYKGQTTVPKFFDTEAESIDHLQFYIYRDSGAAFRSKSRFALRASGDSSDLAQLSK